MQVEVAEGGGRSFRPPETAASYSRGIKGLCSGRIRKIFSELMEFY